ncbi:hypothetical protein K435DRAFT_973799 [Dendrothele bispora CBS 962.96]|uniref:Zn(2)-C6 fungal-type domain-containing protein n=1 Tax=Dendrothele bispora (strain CBS 962.96) TaxID=1314807 RepID=A0A4V4HB33_DENBC|nr:hypothetical protein K435DRAFT_846249 [Dendrothele bispora CBS 962.96]THU77835.1 hypothetical protein K435DRAFT_973799 [Dendrothele bispora CBS 962.96]
MERFDLTEDLKEQFGKAYLQQPPRAERAKWLEDNKGLSCTNCRRKGIRCVPQSGPRAGAGCVACLHRGGHEPVCSRLLEERKARVISKLRISESMYIVLRKWFEEEKQVTATAKKKNKAAAEQSNGSASFATPSGSSTTTTTTATAATATMTNANLPSSTKPGNGGVRIQTRSTASTSLGPTRPTEIPEDLQDAASDGSFEIPLYNDSRLDPSPPEHSEQTSMSLEAEITKIIEENQVMIDKCDELLRPTRNAPNAQ